MSTTSRYSRLPMLPRYGSRRTIRWALLLSTQLLVEANTGTAIGEVPAIWRYLEEVYPAQPLLGSTPKDKALVAMWERRAELEGFAAVMEGVRNAAERLKGRAIAGPHDYDQIPALAERSRLRVKNFCEDLDTRLAEVPFVAGNTFSAADITALVTVDFATKAMGFSAPGEHAALERWYENVSSRPSVGA
jgi:glutathione S-transferase